MVREIEADTFEENPPLFQEYISAAPDIKAIMDSQFRDVKTHSRLLSRAMWYEWRAKLLDSLKEGLLRISEGLNEDEEVLARQEHLLEPIILQLIEEQRRLATDAKLLQAHADEIANCDQGELNDARQQLDGVEKDLEAEKTMIADLQQKLREQEERMEYLVVRKRECSQEIKDAEKVCEEYHGWSVSEVATLKGKPKTIISYTLFEVSINTFLFSQDRCPRTISRLDHHFRLRLRSNPHLPQHSPNLPYPFILQRL